MTQPSIQGINPGPVALPPPPSPDCEVAFTNWMTQFYNYVQSLAPQGDNNHIIVQRNADGFFINFNPAGLTTNSTGVSEDEETDNSPVLAFIVSGNALNGFRAEIHANGPNEATTSIVTGVKIIEAPISETSPVNTWVYLRPVDVVITGGSES